MGNNSQQSSMASSTPSRVWLKKVKVRQGRSAKEFHTKSNTQQLKDEYEATWQSSYKKETLINVSNIYK